MNTNNTITATPKINRADAESLSAFLDLEGVIADLKHMAFIASILITNELSNPDETRPDGVRVFTFGVDDIDRMMFAAGEVADRAKDVSRRFYLAHRVEGSR